MVEVLVNVAEQRLTWRAATGETRDFAVSTAARGIGQQMGSEQTPVGRHAVRARIGAEQPTRAVFVARRPTGEVWSPALSARHPDRDWVLTRILWLSGLETGVNRGGQVDSMRRFIYVHGTPDDQPLGVPASHGCIRMGNEDVLWLFDRVAPGTPVTISPGQPKTRPGTQRK